MSKVVRVIVGAAAIVGGALTGNFALIATGISMVGGALLGPKQPQSDRTAVAAQLQLGEVPRGAIAGRAGIDGSLVDAFNHGGDDGTDWEVLVIALADHECDALEGFYVGDTYVAFTGDGAVAGYNGQLEVYWKSGTYDQTASTYLTANGPGWTANDRGRSVAYVVAAYKADEPDADNPVWPSGRPQFKWIVRGLKCYQARLDTSVGGSGAHRRNDPSTWQWTENLIDIRYNWVRGIYAGNRVDEPQSLLIGRGLSAIEAPPANVFARANLCDEIVGGAARYRIGGAIFATEKFEDVENDFAAACAGIIVQREGSVEIDPGEAKSVVASFTDDDLIVGSNVQFSDFLGSGDAGWVNTVVAAFTDPDQKWTELGAPVKRDVADIAADGAPREQQLSLGLVTNSPQAQRVAEIFRRLGRLWCRAQVTLPPAFAALEEGDWVNWTSDRHFGGVTKTFRIDAFGSDEGWRHQLTLREIDAAAYSDAAAEADGAVAVQQPAPAALTAPGAAAWSSAGTIVSGSGGSIPAIVVTGAVDRSFVSSIVVEYRVNGASTWQRWGEFSRDFTSATITGVGDQTAYEVAIRYIVDGERTPRLVLAAVTTGALSTASGARTIISRSVAYPLTSDDTSISIAAFTAVLDDGQTLSLPAAPLSPLASGSSFAVFRNIAAGTYFAAASPALSEMADSGLVLIGTQSTSSGGTYTPPVTPDGVGGDGTQPY